MTSRNFIANATNKFNHFENARQFACYIGVAHSKNHQEVP
ncbi:MAG: transposase [Bacteroidetes bacterium]|nr:transposase [Bacteroidota bacterium]